jgi:Phage terminase large subunit
VKAQLLYADQGAVLAQYRKSRKPWQVIMGPIGSAKTTTSIQKLLELICQQRPNKKGERRSRAVAVRNTYPDLLNTTIRDFRQIVDPMRLGTMTMGHPPEMKMDFDLPDGTRVIADIIFLALDKDEHVRKLRGLNITFAWVNEMKEIPKSIIDMLQGRIDRFPTSGTSNWAGIYGDTNAWDSDHWLERIAEAVRQGEMGDWDIFVQPGAVIKVDGRWAVNPARENKLFLTDAYYERQIPGKREDWIKVNLANEIGYFIDGRPVHGDYSDSLHTAREILVPRTGVCYVGIDFGLTPAAAFLQRQADGQWWCFDEIVFEDGDAAMLAEEIKARVAGWEAKAKELTWVYRGDCSGDNRAQSDSSTPFKVLRANGVPALPSSTNDVTLRRAALDRPLTRTVRGKPGIIFSPVCKTIRKGLAGGFAYKRVAVTGSAETFRDVPDKNIFSHVCEALEYGLMDAGEHAGINSGVGGAAPRGQNAIVTRPGWNPLNV